MEHLLQNFYSISNLQTEENKIAATIALNPSHEIYKGHFPEVPVVPGVCQMQLVKELLSEVLKKDLVMQTAENMKFMAVINPMINASLDVKIDFKTTSENIVKINASIFYEALVFFKFSGSFAQN